MIKLAICDDQVLFLRGLNYIISEFDNIEIIIEASSGEELLEKIKLNQPDVLLLDMKMPGMDGLEITKKIKNSDQSKIRIILLTMYDEERLITHVMENGANGYLLKNEEPHIVKEAIEAVADKGFYFNDYVAQAMLKRLQSKDRHHTKTYSNNNLPYKITRREIEILQMICQEKTTSEIANELFISVRTVEGHRKNLMEKSGVRNAAGLVLFAVKNKLVEV